VSFIAAIAMLIVAVWNGATKSARAIVLNFSVFALSLAALLLIPVAAQKLNPTARMTSVGGSFVALACLCVTVGALVLSIAYSLIRWYVSSPPNLMQSQDQPRRR
jgi:hypothetical protein